MRHDTQILLRDVNFGAEGVWVDDQQFMFQQDNSAIQAWRGVQ